MYSIYDALYSIYQTLFHKYIIIALLFNMYFIKNMKIRSLSIMPFVLSLL